eukprot:SAG11_NODE_1660_length_4498_cov_5.293021_7_plen_148_part_00
MPSGLKQKVELLRNKTDKEIQDLVSEGAARYEGSPSTWGMSLTSGMRKGSKKDVMSFATWNCYGTIFERVEFVMGSQDGKTKGPGHDLVIFLEGHGGEQKVAAAWGSKQFVVADAPHKDNPAAGVAIGLSKRMANALLDHGQPHGKT